MKDFIVREILQFESVTITILKNMKLFHFHENKWRFTDFFSLFVCNTDNNLIIQF